MPILQWIGKEKVINHHQDVPIRVLEHKYSYKERSLRLRSENEVEGSSNKIIHGDNLEALKALLPQYQNKIKCIYIDPPYNTGNENWLYNDNVNHPKIKKWLGQVVGKEGEDLSRHDKWLCMMYPRLKLLHKLLSDDGAIFISIDDNEQANLKLIMDEIFGKNCFKANFIWKSRQIVDSRNQSMISVDHEYVIIYSKSNEFKLKGKLSNKSKYSNPDNDPRGAWMSNSILGLANAEQRPNLHYSIIDPETGLEYHCPASTGWRYSKETMQKKILEKRIFFPKKSNGRPREKKFLIELASDYTGFSSILSEEAGFTLNGTRTVREIVPEAKFSFPKPYELIKILVDQISTKNSIILDSFAGSGTTAHAVLNLNKQDGGNRKFILIEMEDYADSITAERVKRVIDGYGEGNNLVEGTGGGFDYYELGEPMFLDDYTLNPSIDIQKIREYIYFSETNLTIDEKIIINENKYFLGLNDNTAYYFYYKKEKPTTLDYNFLKTIKTKAETYLIYADSCLLNEDFLLEKNIIFKKIPRDIPKI